MYNGSWELLFSFHGETSASTTCTVFEIVILVHSVKIDYNTNNKLLRVEHTLPVLRLR